MYGEKGNVNGNQSEGYIYSIIYIYSPWEENGNIAASKLYDMI